MQIVRSCSGSTVVVVLLLLLQTINLNLMNTLTDLRWKIKDGLQPHLHFSLPVHQVMDMMDDQKPILGPTQLNPQITIGCANIKINPKELLGTHTYSPIRLRLSLSLSHGPKPGAAKDVPDSLRKVILLDSEAKLRRNRI